MEENDRLGYSGDIPGDVEVFSFDLTDAKLGFSGGNVYRIPVLINIRVW